MKKLLLLLVLGLTGTWCAAQNMTVCAGSSFTIRSLQDADAATYVWQVNGAPLSVTYYWGSTRINAEFASCVLMADAGDHKLELTYASRSLGLPVRCIRN